MATRPEDVQDNGARERRLTPEGEPHGVEPDEAVKRDTAVFQPGTLRKPR